MKYTEDPMKSVRALEYAGMNIATHIRYRPSWQSSAFFFPVAIVSAWIGDWVVNQSDELTNSPASVSKQLQD
jgi:hypothetical protein